MSSPHSTSLHSRFYLLFSWCSISLRPILEPTAKLTANTNMDTPRNSPTCAFHSVQEIFYRWKSRCGVNAMFAWSSTWKWSSSFIALWRNIQATNPVSPHTDRPFYKPARTELHHQLHVRNSTYPHSHPCSPFLTPSSLRIIQISGQPELIPPLTLIPILTPIVVRSSSRSFVDIRFGQCCESLRFHPKLMCRVGGF